MCSIGCDVGNGFKPFPFFIPQVETCGYGCFIPLGYDPLGRTVPDFLHITTAYCHFIKKSFLFGDQNIIMYLM